MVEDMKALYAQFESEAKSRSSRGEKAEKIRQFVKGAAAQIGKNRLAMAAMYRLAKKNLAQPDEKFDRSYFTNVVEKAFETVKDDEGTVWIEVSKPKTPKQKAE